MAFQEILKQLRSLKPFLSRVMLTRELEEEEEEDDDDDGEEWPGDAEKH